jgi:hypothetical protein
MLALDLILMTTRVIGMIGLCLGMALVAARDI